MNNQNLSPMASTTCFNIFEKKLYLTFQQMQLDLQVFALPLRLFELELELDNAPAQHVLFL